MAETEKKTTKKQQARVAPPLPTVRHVILWTLINAGTIFLSTAVAFIPSAFDMLICLMCIINHPLVVDTSWVQSRTDAEVAVLDAQTVGMYWCTATQAAAGALALMLPSRHGGRLRLLLAYAALVATAAGHSMWAGVAHRMLSVAAKPGGGLCSILWAVVNTAAFVIFGVIDLLCFLGLILRGGEEE